MLALRPNCEFRDRDRPNESLDARICTFCAACADGNLHNVCPNCGGELVHRPRRPAEALLATELRHDPEALVRQAVRADIRASADHLRHGSEVLEQLVQTNRLLVEGATPAG